MSKQSSGKSIKFETEESKEEPPPTDHFGDISDVQEEQGISEEDDIGLHSDEESDSTPQYETFEEQKFVIKNIGDKKFHIPALNLDRIVKKQKRNLYPLNMDSKGNLIETKYEA